ncbi:TetR family transcriptional regulator C-terminal domain-containing protein [Frigidibacter sp. RF13]|uniref:TetR/AcrR family transcriptional regulator n=1 Tax=Frigidibacter sp. RF13 TaxID=2997340 RepID=UPI0022714F7D|nr:TetR family transcriptional regulator C-terminal domain-containing protein [Frigidibacter sp. RF13]MCY1125304.1 TetR family transcriptional regulator C-terminal domain-containing protein [Frigidibacter sp. RF13]
MESRKKFQRKGEVARREQLVEAALEAIAEGGFPSATVREIALRAGVTQGLIRHYFSSKEELTREAYRSFMTAMISQGLDAIPAEESDAAARLACFIAATLRPPVMTDRQVTLWTAFIHRTRSHPDLAEIHNETYLAFRGTVQALLQQMPDVGGPENARMLAIALNGLIDGLWLEGATEENHFDPEEIVEIALMAAGRIVRADLLRHKPPPTDASRSDRKDSA